MNRRLATVAVTAVATLGLVGSASAYTGDPINTGAGFVGKGEVQTPWNWNNKTLQQNAKGVSFTVEGEDRFEFDCEWQTGNPEKPKSLKTHEVTLKRSKAVDKEVVHDIRNNPKSAVTGFDLLRFGTETVTGSVPALGDSCLGEGTDGTVVEIRDLVDTNPAALLAHYSGLNSIVLQDTNPVLTTS